MATNSGNGWNPEDLQRLALTYQDLTFNIYEIISARMCPLSDSEKAMYAQVRILVILCKKISQVITKDPNLFTLQQEITFALAFILPTHGLMILDNGRQVYPQQVRFQDIKKQSGVGTPEYIEISQILVPNGLVYALNSVFDFYATAHDSTFDKTRNVLQLLKALFMFAELICNAQIIDVHLDASRSSIAGELNYGLNSFFPNLLIQLSS